MADLRQSDMELVGGGRGQALAPVSPGALAAQSREASTIQGMIISARHFPRDQQRSFAKIMSACERVSLAEAASYAYPRGGQTISGPSIHLARVLAQSWGNIQASWREVQRDPNGSHVQAWCWDLETNTRFDVEFFVPHIRTTKQGTVQLTDERDIYEVMANMASRRLRACILAVIPGDVVEAAERRCEQTLEEQGAKAEKIPKLIAAFAALEVTKDQIEARLAKRVDAMANAEFLQLRKIYTSLKDGMSKPGDWFPQIHDPQKIVKEAEAAVPAMPSLGEVEAKAKAIAGLTRAASDVRKRGLDPDKMLPKPVAEIVRSGDVGAILSATDILQESKV